MRNLLAVGLLLALCAVAAADTIVMKSGRKMKGVIQSENDQEVVIVIAHGAKMSVSRADIAEIRRHETKLPPPPKTESKPAAKPDAPKSAPEKAAPKKKRKRRSSGGASDGRGVSKKDAKFLYPMLEMRVHAGSILDALAQLEQESGLKIEITDAARRLAQEKGYSVKGYSWEYGIGRWVEAFVDNPSRGNLKWKVHDGGVLIGTKREICGASATETGSGVEWLDAVGDPDTTFDAPDWQRPDVTRLSIEGEERHLVITLTLAEDVMRVLEQRTDSGVVKGYELVRVFLDLDAEPATGGSPSFDDSYEGFDGYVRIATGFEATDGNGNSFSQWGNIESIPGTHTVKRAIVAYGLWKLGRNSGFDREKAQGGKTGEDLTFVSGDQIIAKIPYARLGLRSGKRIRAFFHDAQEEMFSDNRNSKVATFEVN